MSDKAYDYLIVGAGLFGATFAYLAKKAGKKVLVIDKNPVIGGHIYTERKDGIDIHVYGEMRMDAPKEDDLRIHFAARKPQG